MRTFDQIKSNFRVCQIDDSYYVQIKDTFGWSFDTKEMTEYPAFINICFLGMIITISIFLVTIVSLFLTHKYVSATHISAITFFIFLISEILYCYKSKKFSYKGQSLYDAENYINNLVNRILVEDKKEVTKKEKKYHYFYTENQLRKKKLQKLK